MKEVPANLEVDSRFPSGEWTGFFLQYWLPGRHKTDLDLTWQGGTLSGHGTDRVGPFTISGTYDVATGECEWTKQYVGKHSVAYRGRNDGHGIWGVWEIRQLGGLYVDRGGFHIWPEGTNVSEESDHTEQAVMAAMRAEFGNMPLNPSMVILFLLTGIALALFLWWRLHS
jgi:hypothetical protein